MVGAFKRYQALIAVSLALTGSQVHGAPFAYVPNAGSDTVSIINTHRDKVMATIPVGSYPLTVAIHPRRHRVYVTDAHGGTVSVINQRRSVATIPVGNLPLGIAVHPDGTRVYVNHFGQQDYSTCTSSCLGYIGSTLCAPAAATSSPSHTWGRTRVDAPQPRGRPGGAVRIAARAARST
jgi:YVTN family beta-propeller protein